MLTITVRLDEKISTASQYENRTAGVYIEESHLELHSPEEVLKRTSELFALAKQSVEEQLGRKVAAKENGHGGNGNGRPPVTVQAPSPGTPPSSNGNGRKTYGRPKDPPTQKQKNLLRGLAKRQNLGPETIRDICKRVVGKEPKEFTKVDMMKLLDHLLKEEKAA